EAVGEAARHVQDQLGRRRQRFQVADQRLGVQVIDRADADRRCHDRASGEARTVSSHYSESLRFSKLSETILDGGREEGETQRACRPKIKWAGQAEMKRNRARLGRPQMNLRAAKLTLVITFGGAIASVFFPLAAWTVWPVILQPAHRALGHGLL